MENICSHSRVRFGVFEADLGTCELRKRGLRLKLSEQPFQVLAMLMEKPGDLITREHLRNRKEQIKCGCTYFRATLRLRF